MNKWMNNFFLMHSYRTEQNIAKADTVSAKNTVRIFLMIILYAYYNAYQKYKKNSAFDQKWN